jgi:peptidoglycan/LPS O-acetylase OafA/YrhL
LQTQLSDQPALDWLRFALASIVLVEHAGWGIPGPVDAQLAVWVFLALSGWLIGGILLRTSPQELPRFYFNRAIRIWIPYGCAIIMLYAVAAAREGIDFNWWKYLLYDVTFTHYNFTVFPEALEELPLDATGNNFWSLSVEEQFYLIAPLLLCFAGLLPRLIALLAFVLAVVFAGVAFLPIAGGVLAAVAQKQFGDFHLVMSGRIVFLAMTAATYTALYWFDDDWLRTIFSVALVLVLSVHGRRNRLALFFGAISFPLYLNGWIGMFAANFATRRVEDLEFLAVPMQYCFAVIVASLCWYFIDRPVRLRRELWYTPQRGRMAAILAYCIVMTGLVGGFLWNRLSA